MSLQKLRMAFEQAKDHLTDMQKILISPSILCDDIHEKKRVSTLIDEAELFYT